MLKTLISYCKQNPEDVELAFNMLESLKEASDNDFSFLYKFYKYYIP